MTAFETIITEQHAVHCDGGGGALGHPRVYLHLESDTGMTVCPYCSRTYMLRAASEYYAKQKFA